MDRRCRSKVAVYSCPRCNASYCTLTCYKNHGVQCTEAFYKEHVVSNMRCEAEDADVSERHRAMKKVMRSEEKYQEFDNLEEQNIFLNADTDEIIERLEKLSAQDTIRPEDLSEHERLEFWKMVRKGSFQKFIKIWVPWWTMNCNEYMKNTNCKRLGAIQEINTTNVVSDYKIDPEVSVEPVIIDSPSVPYQLFSSSIKIPAFKTLCPGPYSKHLKVALAEFLYCYAMIMRLYNGDWTDASLEVAAELVSVTQFLDQIQGTIKEVLSTTDEKMRGHQYMSFTDNKNLHMQRLQDVECLLSSTDFVLDALWDAYQMAKCAIHAFTKVQKSSHRPNRLVKKQLQRLEKKLQYYISWCHDCDVNSEFQSVINDLTLEF